MELRDILTQSFSTSKILIKKLTPLEKEEIINELNVLIEQQYNRTSKFGAKGVSISQSDYMATLGRIKKYEIILNMLLGYGDFK